VLNGLHQVAGDDEFSGRSEDGRGEHGGWFVEILSGVAWPSEE
jgi:hypothetical protein